MESPGLPGAPAGVFGWPIAPPSKRTVDSPFGVRTIETLGTGEIHDGVDIRAAEGATVVAARDGRVAWVGERPALGWTIILEHPDRWQTVYGNLSRATVNVGESVPKGSPIGLTSSRCDGDEGGCLHFEIRWQGRAVDPAPLLGGR